MLICKLMLSRRGRGEGDLQINRSGRGVRDKNVENRWSRRKMLIGYFCVLYDKHRKNTSLRLRCYDEPIRSFARNNNAPLHETNSVCLKTTLNCWKKKAENYYITLQCLPLSDSLSRAVRSRNAPLSNDGNSIK